MKDWKSALWHFKKIIYSFSNQIILSSYSVPVREVFILSIK